MAEGAGRRVVDLAELDGPITDHITVHGQSAHDQDPAVVQCCRRHPDALVSAQGGGSAERIRRRVVQFGGGRIFAVPGDQQDAAIRQ